MVQYYREMWPKRYHVLAHMTEVDIIPKGISILWNDKLEVEFRDIKNMVSTETLLNYPEWKITFTVHKYAYYKQLGNVISKMDKTIDLLLRKNQASHILITLQQIRNFYQ